MKYFLLFALAAPLTLTAQDKEPIIYTEVVSVDSASAEELYRRAKTFFVNMYKSANDVIQLDDAKSGTVIGKGNIPVVMSLSLGVKNATRVDHTFAIYVKDGRYKYEIKNLIVKYNTDATQYTRSQEVSVPLHEYKTGKKVHERYLADVDAEFKKIIEQMKRYMSRPSEVKSDW